MAKRGHLGHLTWSHVLLLHCIVGPYVLILYVMFHLNLKTIMMMFELT